MNFEARNFDKEKHYDLMKSWYVARGLEAPAPENLSPVGCLVETCGKPIAAGFIYENNTPNPVISNLISDSSVERQTRSNAVDFLIINLYKACEYRGYKSVLCSSNFEPAKKHFEKLGFEKVEENVTIYRRVF